MVCHIANDSSPVESTEFHCVRALHANHLRGRSDCEQSRCDERWIPSDELQAEPLPAEITTEPYDRHQLAFCIYMPGMPRTQRPRAQGRVASPRQDPG